MRQSIQKIQKYKTIVEQTSEMEQKQKQEQEILRSAQLMNTT